MRIRLHKTNRERHVLEVVRDDGTSSSVELETRSLLRHDLMHWAFERRAALASSVFGRLAMGADPAARELAPARPVPEPDPAELAATEVLVGMLQGASRGNVDPAAFVALAADYLPQLGHALPPCVTPELVRAVLADHAKLVGQWEALRPGGVLQLEGSFA